MSQHAAIAAPAGSLGLREPEQRNHDHDADQQAPGSGEEEKQRGVVETPGPQFGLVQNVALIVTFAGLQLAWVAGLLYLGDQLFQLVAARF